MSDSRSKSQKPVRESGLIESEPTPPGDAGDPIEDKEPVMASVYLADNHWQRQQVAPRPGVKVVPVRDPDPAPPEPAPLESLAEDEPLSDSWARPQIVAESDNADVNLRPFFDFYGV